MVPRRSAGSAAERFPLRRMIVEHPEVCCKRPATRLSHFHPRPMTTSAGRPRPPRPNAEGRRRDGVRGCPVQPAAGPGVERRTDPHRPSMSAWRRSTWRRRKSGEDVRPEVVGPIRPGLRPGPQGGRVLCQRAARRGAGRAVPVGGHPGPRRIRPDEPLFLLHRLAAQLPTAIGVRGTALPLSYGESLRSHDRDAGSSQAHSSTSVCHHPMSHASTLAHTRRNCCWGT
jgi:hypothetical protein